MRGVGWLVAASAGAPLLVRLALRRELGLPPSWGDAVGVASDLGAALLFGSLLVVLVRRRLAWGLLAQILWCLLQYGSYEHVKATGAGLQLTFAHYVADSTFFLGSVLAPTAPLLLAALLALSLGSTWRLARAAGAGSGAAPRPLLLAASAALVLLGLSLLPGEGPASWRRRHFVHENVEHRLRELLRRSQAPPTSPEAAPPLEPLAVFRPDLEGEARVALPRPGSNVLLVVLEGIPANALAASARLSPDPVLWPMPRLGALAERNVVATSFVSQQRQTNRGLYALLCGDLPRLGVELARMAEIALRGADRDCLPAVLGRAGYRSVYLQGAPLSFMYKDAFMEAIGFDRVLGNAHFEAPAARTRWGVDDGTLFGESLAQVRALEAAPEPWLLVVLSVGTHIPATLPSVEGRSFAHAVRYLDRVLTEFVAALEADGTLDDTLVLVTSDESRGWASSSEVREGVSRSWAPFVALLPTKDRLVISEPYAQSDVALSIADYLGIPADDVPFVGRSLFRSYATPRTIPFANVFLRRSGAVSGAGASAALYWCGLGARDCARHRVEPPAWLVPGVESFPPDPGELAALAQVMTHSVRAERLRGRRAEYALLGESRVPLFEVPALAVIDGQNLDVPAGSRVEVDIGFRVDGGAGEVSLVHHLGRPGGRDLVAFEIPPLRAGDRVSIAYELGLLERTSSLNCSLRTTAVAGRGLAIEFDSAQLRVRPLERERRPRASGLLAPVMLKVERATESEATAEARPYTPAPR